MSSSRFAALTWTSAFAIDVVFARAHSCGYWSRVDVWAVPGGPWPHLAVVVCADGLNVSSAGCGSRPGRTRTPVPTLAQGLFLRNHVCTQGHTLADVPRAAGAEGRSAMCLCPQPPHVTPAPPVPLRLVLPRSTLHNPPVLWSSPVSPPLPLTHSPSIWPGTHEWPSVRQCVRVQGAEAVAPPGKLRKVGGGEGGAGVGVRGGDVSTGMEDGG